jgi:hypothetical protein
MKRFLNVLFFFAGGLLAAYIGVVRPLLARWNATDDEVLGVNPGDELVRNPLLQTTHSILVQAPAEKVWPWLLQIGYGRGGFYSFDQLERAAGLKDLRSATQIDPDLQKLKVGDTVPISPVTPMTVEVLKPNRALVLHMMMSPFTAQALPRHNPPEPWMDWSWAFILTPLNDYTCRLTSRVRAIYSPYLLMWPLMAIVLEPVAFAMDQKMLATLKARAEENR